MNFKIDFPYPPEHHKYITQQNYQQKPNLDKFFKQTKKLILFGQEFNLEDQAIKIIPNYLEKCNKTFFENISLKQDLIILLKRLKEKFIEFLECLGHKTEKLQEIQNNIYQITLQIYYLLKIAKFTLEAPLNLQAVLKSEKENLQKNIQAQKNFIEKLRQELS